MNRIAELRKKHGFSQAELAKQVKIAQNTLSQYETEIRTPTRRVIEALSQIFEVSENYLLGFPEEQTITENSHQKINITDITKVKRLESESDVNFYLNLGWHLLFIGTDSEHHEDMRGYSQVVYVLGWTGDPNNTLVEFPDDEDDQYPEPGGYGWKGEGIY